jgi:predicted amidohydrolase
MKIAIYQCEGRPGRTEDNLAMLRRSALEAAGQGAQLLICSEMFLTGYNIGDTVFELAETANGSSMQEVAEIAREANIAVLYGYPERFEDVVYNSALLLDRKGTPLANYRKTHLYGPEECRLFQTGDYFITAELKGLKIGILICYDLEFPEAVRALALAGAELIAVPTALMEPYCRVAQLVVPTRAYENQVFVAYANRCGHEADLNYCGLSCIVGPDGQDRVRAGTVEGLFVAEINVADMIASRGKNPYLSDLRSEFYRKTVRTGTRGSYPPPLNERKPD